MRNTQNYISNVLHNCNTFINEIRNQTYQKIVSLSLQHHLSQAYNSSIEKKRGKKVTLPDPFGTLEIGIHYIINFNKNSSIFKDFFDLAAKGIRETHGLQAFDKEILVDFVKSLLKIQVENNIHMLFNMSMMQNLMQGHNPIYNRPFFHESILIDPYNFLNIRLKPN
jgi:hypothetical protein